MSLTLEDVAAQAQTWADLANVIHDALGPDCRGEHAVCFDAAEAVLASDWLAAREAAARADEQRKTLIEAADKFPSAHSGVWAPLSVAQWLRDRAGEATP